MIVINVITHYGLIRSAPSEVEFWIDVYLLFDGEVFVDLDSGIWKAHAVVVHVTTHRGLADDAGHRFLVADLRRKND